VTKNSVNIYHDVSGDVTRASSPSPSFSSWEMLLRQKLAEGEMHESENSQLPSLWQNLDKRALGRKKFNKPEDCQVPLVQKHKELEIWKTQGPIWSNSEIYLQRMWCQVFIFYLVSQTFFFLSLAAWRFSS